jgi:hypothetical protein
MVIESRGNLTFGRRLGIEIKYFRKMEYSKIRNQP